MQELIHTPDGVRDIYDGEFAAKLEVEERIRKVLRLYGCSELSTPAFEFFDVFSRERGSVPSRELFKFFDREGNTLVLRPDMTPPAARCAAKYYMDEKTPIRLSYLADTFINHGNYQGRLKEVTVQGAEFIGDGSVNEDAELLALTIECLLASGLTKFQVDVGEVGFFAGLVDEAGLSAETEQTLRALIEDKNFFGVEELMEGQSLKPELLQVFLKLPELFGPAEILDAAEAMAGNERSLKAVRRLKRLTASLTATAFPVTYPLIWECLASISIYRNHLPGRYLGHGRAGGLRRPLRRPHGPVWKGCPRSGLRRFRGRADDGLFKAADSPFCPRPGRRSSDIRARF